RITGTPSAVAAAANYVITATVGGSPVLDTLVLAVTAGTPPGASGAVTATALSGQATVTCSGATRGSSAITGYQVRATQDTTKGCTWESGPLTCNVTGLTNGTAYTFEVRATSAVGNGAFSQPSNSVTPAGPPGAPTNV